MSSSVQTVVKQLTNRLETASLTERLDALQELQSLARTEANLIGQLSLQTVVDLLKEQSGVEEYQEALDLIHRLVTSRDHTTSQANVGLFLNHSGNIELLLDLLEHEDPTVGVMTSQILTEIHSKDGLTLEKQIHACPAGMNKLLQRLPDSSREEVRNQAIVLVQQLTVKNEEMKKTVVFNEGFELLFGIIKSEGGSQDAGLVIKDCLQICNNILTESETCQRLFYGMGGEWVMNLSDFFDPTLLESIKLESSLDDSKLDNGEDGSSGCWFQHPTRMDCAILALDSIAKSLHIPNPKHQNLVGISISTLLPSAAFWIGRQGPAEIIDISLELLSNVISNNAFIAQHLYNATVRFSAPERGVSIPIDVREPSLAFGWRPLPSDERRIISVPALLAERYIYSSAAWPAASPPSSSLSSSSLRSSGSEYNSSAVDGLSRGCLLVFEKVLIADPSISYLIIQQILAPIPLDEEESEEGSTLENAKPLGALLLTLLVEGSSRVTASVGSNAGMSSAILRSEVDVLERCVNLFTLLFVYGGALARELSTAITTAHTSVAYSSRGPHDTLLPYLLSAAGVAAKLQSPPGAGHAIIVALLRMLASSCCDCERSSKLILSDPSNLFVVDFATSGSENAGVPAAVQIMSCLFLGCVFLTLPSADLSSSDQQTILSRKGFLGMIDSRIGLNRFTDLLRRPIKAKGATLKSLSGALFITPGYKVFYEKQVDMIVAGIFEFYSGDASVGDAGSTFVEKEIIDSQNKVICELREQIAALESNANSATISTVNFNSDSSKEEMESLREKLLTLQQTLSERESYVSDMMNAEAVLTNELQLVKNSKEELEMMLKETQNLYLNSTKQLSDDISNSSRLAEENLMLKETILLQDKDLKYVQDALEQRDRKILLMEDELQSPMPQHSHELAVRDTKIANLESSIDELKQQLLALETVEQIADANNQVDVANSSLKDILHAIVALADVIGVELGDSDDLLLSSNYLVKSLHDCVDSIYFSAGTSSDIAEAIGVTSLEGKEGSVRRMVSCAEKLREHAQISLDGATVRIEELETEIFNKDFTIAELGTTCEELSDSLNTVKAELERTQNECSDSRSQIEALSAKVNAASNDDSIKVLRSQLMKVTQESSIHRSEAATVKGQADALREQTVRLSAEVSSLKEEASSRNNRDDLLVLEQEIARLAFEISGRDSCIQQQQEELSQLSIRLNEQSELRQAREDDLEGTSAALRAVNEELAGLRREFADFKVAADREGRAAQELASQKASLEASVSSASAALAFRENEVGELRKFLETTVAWLQRKNQSHTGDPSPFASSSSSSSEAIIASFREALEIFGRRHEEQMSSLRNDVAQQQKQHSMSAVAAVEPRALTSALFPKTPSKEVSIINSSETPSYLAGTGNVELVRLRNELQNERRRLFEVQENMSDMLSLLAQQETELTIFRGTLEGLCGTQAVYGAEEHARRLVSEKYGNYIDFRGDSNSDNNRTEAYAPISSTNISAGNNGDQSLDMSIWN